MVLLCRPCWGTKPFFCPFFSLTTLWPSSSAEGEVFPSLWRRIWGCWWAKRGQCTLTALRFNPIVGCIRSMAGRSREGILPLCSALVGSYLAVCVQLWHLQHQKDMDLLERVQKVIRRLEHTSCEERLREVGSFSPRRRLHGHLIAAF